MVKITKQYLIGLKKQGLEHIHTIIEISESEKNLQFFRFLKKKNEIFNLHRQKNR